MKTVLEVSLREAGKAQESINDNPALRVELEQVASDMWELPAYDENEEDEVEAHDQLMCDIDDQLKRCGIPTDEYWFNDINEEE